MKFVRPRRLVSIGLFVMFVIGIGTADAQKLAAGQNHTLVVKPGGSVWAVGRNNQGQLGDNSTTDRITPVQVNGLSNIVAVAAGEQHSMALARPAANIRWRCWGTARPGRGATPGWVSWAAVPPRALIRPNSWRVASRRLPPGRITRSS